MRTLKTIVIVMGVLIFLGTAVLIGLIAKNIIAKETPTSQPNLQTPIQTTSQNLIIPKGFKVRFVALSGQNLILMLQNTSDVQRILVIQATTGQIIHSYSLQS